MAVVLAVAHWIVPIPGTTKPHRVLENVGALDVTLSASDLAELTDASDRIATAGDRYPEAMQRWINR